MRQTGFLHWNYTYLNDYGFTYSNYLNAQDQLRNAPNELQSHLDEFKDVLQSFFDAYNTKVTYQELKHYIMDNMESREIAHLLTSRILLPKARQYFGMTYPYKQLEGFFDKHADSWNIKIWLRIRYWQSNLHGLYFTCEKHSRVLLQR